MFGQEIPSEHLGEIEGTPIQAYVLTSPSGFVRVRISTYGAGLMSVELRRPDTGEYELVTLTLSHLQAYRDDEAYMGCTVGRVANRIGNGIFELDYKRYQLAANSAPHHLHGGYVGWGKRVWSVVNSSVSSNGTTLVLSLTSTDGEEGYPGTVNVRVTYNLDSNDALSMNYQAETDAATVINMTNHAYWNLGGWQRAAAEGGEGAVAASLAGHTVVVDADRYLPSDLSGLPLGRVDPVEGTAFDFRVPRQLGSMLHAAPGGNGIDHCLLFRGRCTTLPQLDSYTPSDQPPAEVHPLAQVATVTHPATGYVMDVYTTQPSAQMYTGGFLRTTAGSGGATFGRFGGVCFETQHPPNAAKQVRFGAVPGHAPQSISSSWMPVCI